MRDLLGKMRSTRVRAILALGVFFVFASAGTLAYWTAQSNVPGATFLTGNFDLKVNGLDDLTWTGLKDAKLAQGESIAFHVTLKNIGTPRLSWTATGSTSGDLDALQYRFYVGGTSANSVDSATGNRVGTCGGVTAQVADPVALSKDAANATALTSNTQNLGLDPSESIDVCVLVSLPSITDAQRGKSATPVFTFDAKQVAR